LVAVAHGGSDGLCVCFAFAFELGETAAGRIAANSGQIWMLKNDLSAVDGEGGQHGRFESPLAGKATTVKL
jgi:hypothetical protein